MRKASVFLHGAAAAALIFGASSRAFGFNDISDGTANAAVYWNDATVNAIKNTSAAPTVAARALFIVHSAMFDAWAAYDAKAIGSIPDAPPRQPASAHTTINKSSTISYAAYRPLLDLFPTQEPAFTRLMIDLVTIRRSNPRIRRTRPASKMPPLRPRSRSVTAMVPTKWRTWAAHHIRTTRTTSR